VVVETVSQWSNRQIALALGISLVLLIVLLVFAIPLLTEFTMLWNNVTGFAIMAPLVHAAVRRKWFASVSHVLLTIAIAIISSNTLLTSAWTEWRLGGALLAALVSAAVVEGFVRLLSRIHGGEYEEKWRQDVGWLALMAVVATMVYLAIFWGPYSALNPAQWIGAAVLGALGRGIGNIIHESMVQRRARTKRGE
jgi:hypothetical protein